MRVFNIGQLLTMEQGIDLIENAYLDWHQGRITGYGPMSEVSSVEDTDIDAHGCVVLPGFVDCHTHLAHAGQMHGSFADRCAAVEQIPLAQLSEDIEQRLRSMTRLGTTTVEIKTGYATSVAAIQKCLQAVPSRPGIILTEMSPLANSSAPLWTLANQPRFIDALCDQDGFSPEQLREPLHAMRSLEARIKLHVCVTAPGDGVPLALEMNATSVDHLLFATDRDIQLLARSSTTAVLLPAMAYYSRLGRFAPARALLDSGARVALATDCNPGDSPTWSMPFVIHLAVREMQMSVEEALQAATIHAAVAIGESHRVGSLRVGKDADFLLLATQDYRDVPSVMGANLVERVFRNGVEQ